jgi:hypothetical protein
MGSISGPSWGVFASLPSLGVPIAVAAATSKDGGAAPINDLLARLVTNKQRM